MKAEDAHQAGQTLAEHGVTVGENLFTPKLEYLARHAHREAPTRLTPELLSNDILLNPVLTAVLEQVLGPGFVIARVNVGAGAPACLATTVERARLFEDEEANMRVPAFSVSVFSPLQPCAVVVTTQGLQQELALVPGDALFVDSRGLAQVPDPVPALFATFTRAWFREPLASPLEPPVSISTFDYLRLGRSEQARLQWRFDRYLKQRPRLLAYRMADRIPSAFGEPLKRALRGWASSY